MYKFLLSCHIIAFTAWMAGLFYLPRLFAYHAEEESSSVTAQKFIIMEQRLLKIIMNPAMLLTWFFGLLLFFTNDYGHYLWFLLKIIAVLLLTFFHFYLAKSRKQFITGNNQKTGKFYRQINEIPTILLIIIVFLVIYKP